MPSIVPKTFYHTIYNSLFKSHLEFGILAFGCAKPSKLKKIVTLQKKCVRNVKNVGFMSHTDPLFNELKMLRFEDLFKYNVCTFLHKYSTKRLPASFDNIFTFLRETDDRNNRDSFYNFKVETPKNKALNTFPRVVFLPIWNSLSSLLQSTESHKVFKNDLQKDLVARYGDFVSCDNILCEECRNNAN